jgi:hypothetical protein
VQRLDDHWRGESGDPSWTKQVESWLSEEFRRRNIPGTIDSVDCRKTLCKAGVQFESPNAAIAIYAIEMEPSNEWFSDLRQQGTSAEVTMFLGAPGVELRKIGDDPQIR